jgi:hypothetical protein
MGGRLGNGGRLGRGGRLGSAMRGNGSGLELSSPPVPERTNTGLRASESDSSSTRGAGTPNNVPGLEGWRSDIAAA